MEKRSFSSLRNMKNYFTILTVFAQVEKENGSFEYLHDRAWLKKQLFHRWVRGHWKRVDTHTLDGYACLHSCDTQHVFMLLTKEKEILKKVETSRFRKALVRYTDSAWRLVIRCCLFTPQPFGLEGYCGAGGRAGRCQTCGTHISVSAWRIFCGIV